MSRASVQTRSSLKAVLVLAGASLILSACGTGGDNPDGLDLEAAFLTPVAAAQEAGVPVYWLGPSFEADGLSFYGGSARFESNQDALYVRIEYLADVQSGGSIGFTVTIYSPEGWEAAKERVLPRTAGVTREDIVVHGWVGQLLNVPAGRWVNRLVILDAPSSVVVAGANTTISDGRQTNPLIDVDRLLALMEDLRPYPE